MEAKQSVIENMAPVLTRLFTPLFTVLLLVFLATMAWTGSPIDVKREVLIGFDLLLVLVVGLVLYAASARDPQAPPDLFDGLQLLLVVSALVVDGVALAAIAARISEFGFTPNRVAALGENLILLVNLAWSAWLYARFLRRRGSFAAWSDGRSPTCRCTPYGRHWWSSCSRPSSATVIRARGALASASPPEVNPQGPLFRPRERVPHDRRVPAALDAFEGVDVAVRTG